MSIIYVKPWCRIGPYCVGIYSGYFLETKNPLNFGRLLHALLWCLALCFFASLVFGPCRWYQGLNDPQWVYSLYGSTGKSLFAIALAWVVIACSTGNGGFVNSFLSSKHFVPLSRMTYVAYLIHPLVIVFFGEMMNDITSLYVLVVVYFGLLAISFGISFFFSLMVEVPFIALEKVMFQNKA